MHVKLLQRKLDGGFVEPNQHTEFTINPQQFNEKFYIQDKKDKFNRPNKYNNYNNYKRWWKKKNIKNIKKIKKG